ncbi:MAG TPA: hypothetical protein VK750_03710, partial [Cytophagaceae bacterium]|nr:hypothetical protein [Cytophagaceae bacterium]
TVFILLVTLLFLLYRYFGKERKSLWFLSFVILLQYFDISMDGFILSSNDREYISPIDTLSQEQILASRSVKFLGKGFNMEIAAFSLLHNKPLNMFYISREPSDLTIKRMEQELIDLKNGKLNPKDLYLISPPDLPLNVSFDVHNFYDRMLSITPASYHSTKDVGIRLIHKQSDSLATLVRQIKTSALVLVSVREDAYAQMPEFFKHTMDSLYHTELNKLTWRDSYVAVFSQGKLVKEILGADNLIVEYTGSIMNYSLYLKSKGFDLVSESSIRVNGVSHSLNLNGLNVSVLEKEGGDWSIYNYNTSSQLYTY